MKMCKKPETEPSMVVWLSLTGGHDGIKTDPDMRHWSRQHLLMKMGISASSQLTG